MCSSDEGCECGAEKKIKVIEAFICYLLCVPRRNVELAQKQEKNNRYVGEQRGVETTIEYIEF